MKKFLLASLFSWLLFGNLAAAQPVDPNKRAQAKEKFLGAEKEYKAGRYGNALEGYYDAFVLSGEPLLLYNVGQCYRNLGRYAEAVQTYRDFVVRAPETPFTPKAEKWIAELAPKVEPLTPPTPGTQPASSQPASEVASPPTIAPDSLPVKEVLVPDAVSLQKDQLRVKISEDERGLEKAKRLNKLGGAWVGGGLVFGGATVYLMNQTRNKQQEVGNSIDDIKASRRQAFAMGVVADACFVMGGVYLQKAFVLASKEKTAKIEFAALPAGGELALSLAW